MYMQSISPFVWFSTRHTRLAHATVQARAALLLGLEYVGAIWVICLASCSGTYAWRAVLLPLHCPINFGSRPSKPDLARKYCRMLLGRQRRKTGRCEGFCQSHVVCFPFASFLTILNDSFIFSLFFELLTFQCLNLVQIEVTRWCDAEYPCFDPAKWPSGDPSFGPELMKSWWNRMHSISPESQTRHRVTQSLIQSCWLWP